MLTECTKLRNWKKHTEEMTTEEMKNHWIFVIFIIFTSIQFNFAIKKRRDENDVLSLAFLCAPSFGILSSSSLLPAELMSPLHMFHSPSFFARSSFSFSFFCLVSYIMFRISLRNSKCHSRSPLLSVSHLHLFIQQLSQSQSEIKYNFSSALSFRVCVPLSLVFVLLNSLSTPLGEFEYPVVERSA